MIWWFDVGLAVGICSWDVSVVVELVMVVGFDKQDTFNLHHIITTPHHHLYHITTFTTSPPYHHLYHVTSTLPPHPTITTPPPLPHHLHHTTSTTPPHHLYHLTSTTLPHLHHHHTTSSLLPHHHHHAGSSRWSGHIREGRPSGRLCLRLRHRTVPLP